MALPMELASLIPASTIIPVVTWVIFGPWPPAARITAPAPVTVHWAVGVRWPPYSSGKRNCRSAEQKWEPVRAQAFAAKPPSITMAARPRDSAMVEQAPYTPM